MESTHIHFSSGTIDFFWARNVPHTLLQQQVMKEERSSFEEHTASVTVTDTVLARCYASLHCPPLHLTLPLPPVVCLHVCVCLCVCVCVCVSVCVSMCVCDLILNTMKV